MAVRVYLWLEGGHHLSGMVEEDNRPAREIDYDLVHRGKYDTVRVLEDGEKTPTAVFCDRVVAWRLV